MQLKFNLSLNFMCSSVYKCGFHCNVLLRKANEKMYPLGHLSHGFRPQTLTPQTIMCFHSSLFFFTLSQNFAWYQSGLIMKFLNLFVGFRLGVSIHPLDPTHPLELTRLNPPAINPRALAVGGGFQILETNSGGSVDRFSSLKLESTHLTIKRRKIGQL